MASPYEKALEKLSLEKREIVKRLLMETPPPLTAGEKTALDAFMTALRVPK